LGIDVYGFTEKNFNIFWRLGLHDGAGDFGGRERTGALDRGELEKVEVAFVEEVMSTSAAREFVRRRDPRNLAKDEDAVWSWHGEDFSFGLG